MFDIQIYKHEQDIADKIRAGSLISHLTKVEPIELVNIPEQLQASIFSAKSSENERKNFDLFFLRSLLASSVWNGNDDYFLPIELWAARNTAAHKPFNYEHECDDIIGHMVSSYVVDDDGKVLADGTLSVDLPDNIHIISGAVLYKYWSKEEKQQRMIKLLGEIVNNEWYVSVECLFPKFDYLIKNEDKYQLVARNDQTSFLTKHLRAYGGSGVYNSQKIARVPRNLIISGKGLVKNPANKISTIFAKQYELSKNSIQLINILKENTMTEQEYKDEINKMDSENKGLRAKIDELTNKMSELVKDKEADDKKNHEHVLSSLKTQVEAKDQEINALKASIEKINTEKLEASKQVEELQKLKADAEQKLAAIESDKKYNERVQLCKSKLNLDDANAKKFTDSLKLLDETAFTQHVEFQTQFVSKSAKVDVPAKVDTDVKVLDKVEKSKDISLGVNTTETKTDINKLASSLRDFMEKKNYSQNAEPKFKS